MMKQQRTRVCRVRLDGEVTVRRLLPPQLRTTASIRHGELEEPIERVAERVGVDVETIEGLVDAQGLTLFGKLQHGAEIFLAGAVAASSIISKGENGGAGDMASLMLLPPDATVAWAYDPRMLLHVPPVDRVPETPYRLQRAVESLQAAPRAMELLPLELRRQEGEEKETTTTAVAEAKGTTKTATAIKSDVDPQTPALESCWISPRLATLDEFALCHDTARYHDFVEHGTALAPPLKTDVYCNDGTSSTATRLAVAAVIDAARRALRGAPSFAFCLVRPPGHHCTADTPSGFCLANNVAIAARQLLHDWRSSGKSNGAKSAPPHIAIVDLDVHHGEGTQTFVEEESPYGTASVSPLLYLSLHRYDHGTFYPCDPRGDTAYVGRHHNVCNVAVHTGASDPSCCEEVLSDAVFERVVDDVFLPRLQKFRPDIVLLSLGFDAAYGDPLGRMAVEGGFAYAVRALKRFCIQQQRPAGLVVALEGGYSPEAVAQGVVAVAHALRYPADDADVVRYASRRVPKTWQDLRQRLARKKLAAQQQKQTEGHNEHQQEKKSKDEVSCAAISAPPARDGGVGAALMQIPEDEVLLEKHLRWCDRLIARVLATHAEANRRK
ncbi:putative histone deacetylase [Trypanosoma grayi]|uniref:putative histone deacetylase n=1 Tax=Trypanosoma grayi TaxID=71804 RepID=UPI0004F42111|nr:putative histone deacetylase [Trypanosoma grayi]KEG13764.1 putative histone deacetylase [Trypanosoma grayi]